MGPWGDTESDVDEELERFLEVPDPFVALSPGSLEPTADLKKPTVTIGRALYEELLADRRRCERLDADLASLRELLGRIFGP